MTREEAIKKVKGCLTDYFPADCYEEVEEIIKALEQEPRWIPCSKMFPPIKNNSSARALVTTSWGLVKEAYYCVNHWEIGDIAYKLSSVIAWMPLPASFRKGEAE